MIKIPRLWLARDWNCLLSILRKEHSLSTHQISLDLALKKRKGGPKKRKESHWRKRTWRRKHCVSSPGNMNRGIWIWGFWTKWADSSELFHKCLSFFSFIAISTSKATKLSPLASPSVTACMSCKIRFSLNLSFLNITMPFTNTLTIEGSSDLKFWLRARYSSINGITISAWFARRSLKAIAAWFREFLHRRELGSACSWFHPALIQQRRSRRAWRGQAQCRPSNPRKSREPFLLLG